MPPTSRTSHASLPRARNRVGKAERVFSASDLFFPPHPHLASSLFDSTAAIIAIYAPASRNDDIPAFLLRTNVVSGTSQERPRGVCSADACHNRVSAVRLTRPSPTSLAVPPTLVHSTHLSLPSRSGTYIYSSRPRFGSACCIVYCPANVPVTHGTRSIPSLACVSVPVPVSPSCCHSYYPQPHSRSLYQHLYSSIGLGTECKRLGIPQQCAFVPACLRLFAESCAVCAGATDRGD